MRIPDDIARKFVDISYKLDPSNIYRDGEASESEVEKTYAELRQEWRKLELEVGYVIPEYVIENWIGLQGLKEIYYYRNLDAFEQEYFDIQIKAIGEE
tara:strand:+ start:1613 stop:1906 length:294 start_codon:yes stop_codon:yes gene_type:complete